MRRNFSWWRALGRNVNSRKLTQGGFSPLFSLKEAQKVGMPQDWQCWPQWAHWGVVQSIFLAMYFGQQVAHCSRNCQAIRPVAHLPSPADVRTGCPWGISTRSLSEITCFKMKLSVQAEIGLHSEGWGLWKLVFLFDFPVVNNYGFGILKLWVPNSWHLNYEMLHEILTNLKLINTGLC